MRISGGRQPNGADRSRVNAARSHDCEGDRRLAAVSVTAAAVAVSLFLASHTRAAETVDYVTQLKPVLAERCYACHGV